MKEMTKAAALGGAMLGRLWRPRADRPARVAGEEAGADEAMFRMQTSEIPRAPQDKKRSPYNLDPQ
jgi:hypothetical protein